MVDIQPSRLNLPRRHVNQMRNIALPLASGRDSAKSNRRPTRKRPASRAIGASPFRGNRDDFKRSALRPLCP